MATFGIIAALVVGVLAGGISAGSALVEDADNWNKLQKEKTNVEDLYTLQKEEAELEFKNAQDEANRNADKAEKGADLVDLGADITETAISNDFNTAIDNLYLSQASDTMSWNNALMQAGNSQGASYAALAGSGVRAGGSLSDAILMESAVNNSQLQFAQDTKRRSDNNNLAGVLNQLAGNRYGIFQNRYGADATRDDALYLRNSFLEGGNNYNLYQKQKEIAEKKYKQEYTRLKDAQQEIDDYRTLHMLTAFFGGASKGASVGYNAGTKFYEGLNYKTTLGGNN